MRKILFFLFLFFSGHSFAQAQALDIPFDGTEKGQLLAHVLRQKETTHHVRIFFHPQWISSISITEVDPGQKLSDVLHQLFLGTDLSYVEIYPKVLVILKDPEQALLRHRVIETARKEDRPIEAITFGQSAVPKKGPVTISGIVHESKSTDVLPGAVIQVSDNKYSTVTNDLGQFSISLPAGIYAFRISHLDYETKVIDLAAFDDGTLNLELDKVPVVLDEVIVRDQAARDLATSRIGQVQLTVKELKRAPALLGEVDLVKQIQNLPGVTTVGEAAAGFNVRGGSADQNLILYDGLPVYNSSHVFGFFSAFNSEAIRDVSFLRGGIPAEYGGRVSSVLDIRSKDGSLEKWNGNAGLGMITSNLMVNGPLVKDKTSLAASFRSTYSNWLINSIRTDYADLRSSSVFFYDGTLKVTHIISPRTRLSFSTYSSKDAFQLARDTSYSWRHVQGSIRLDHEFTSDLSGELVVGSNVYGYQVQNSHPLTASELSFRINSNLVKAAFHYQQGQHKFHGGVQFLFYAFNPGQLKPSTAGSNAKPLALDKQHSLETALHFSDEYTLNENWLVEGGLRLPLFTSFGSADIYRYAAGQPREVANIVDTARYAKAAFIKTYAGAEPRLSLRWTLTPHSSVKLGYNRVFQFLHLISNATAITPVDIWQPSGYYFKPQRADQLSIGYFTELHQKDYSASAEGFYKAVDNIIDFKDGAELLLNSHLETELLQGKGYSYGIETFISKNTGRLSGSANYTYSRTFREVAGPTSAESINQGRRYPSNFDQPHIFNLSWKFNFTRRHFFTGAFTYHTGRPITIPLSVIALENSTVAYFSDRNQYRIPDYHRLDIAFVMEGNHKRKKRGEGMWVFSLYNVYARKNPYTVFFRNAANGVPQPYQLSIIGTIFPSLSYNVKF